MTPPRPEVDAVGLSAAMKSALTWPRMTDDGRVRIVPNTLYSQTITALHRRGLIDENDWLTADGLAVRTAILDQEKGNG